ncbi:MAG: hypothetical protein PH343_03300 [Nitrospira sp.]|nr:hypothetical protein [Nitrospira sp.]
MKINKHCNGISLTLIILITALCAASCFYLRDSEGQSSAAEINTINLSDRNQNEINFAISTHFDSWGDWRDAINNVINRPMIEKVKVIGIGAGRTEWTYFKWKGHEDRWSNHQKGAKDDLLLTATVAFHKKGAKVAAIIDPYAPNYIKNHPEMAALGFNRRKSNEQVSFFNLVEGEYGKLMLDMIDYISSNYPVDIINITELSYYNYSFNDDDLQSYKKYTGTSGWPGHFFGGINKDDPAIWAWRSDLMERYIKAAADIVHRKGKKLYIDVPVSWEDFSRNARESGLDYKRILKHADKIIVWNYFSLENASPDVSERLSRYLSANFPSDSVYISIGLWEGKRHIDPVALSKAVNYSLKGGAHNIWFTPDYLISTKHWEGLLPFLGSPDKSLQ